MYDSLKKDVTVTIRRLEILHELIRTRYEHAKAEYDASYERYIDAKHELEEATNDYALIEQAIKAMDALYNGKSIEDIDNEEDDCYF